MRTGPVNFCTDTYLFHVVLDPETGGSRPDFGSVHLPLPLPGYWNQLRKVVILACA